MDMGWSVRIPHSGSHLQLYNFFVLLTNLNVQLMCPEAGIFGLL
jgi:hypothetical protein